jgi:hypothetical protein
VAQLLGVHLAARRLADHTVLRIDHIEEFLGILPGLYIRIHCVLIRG